MALGMKWTGVQYEFFCTFIWRNIQYASFLYCTVCLNIQILSVWTNNTPIYHKFSC